MAARPRLKPRTRGSCARARRVQVGVASDAGVVLEGLSDAEMALVARLDGSLDLPALDALAARTGVAPGRVAGLLQALRERHLLLDLPTDRAFLGDLGEARRAALRPDADALAAAYRLPGDGYALLASRRHQHVVVSGEGALPQAVTSLLRAGGVGRVDAGPVAAEALDLDLRHDPGARVPQLVRPDRGRGARLRDRRAVAAAGGGPAAGRRAGPPRPHRAAGRPRPRAVPALPGPAPLRPRPRVAGAAGSAGTPGARSRRRPRSPPRRR